VGRNPQFRSIDRAIAQGGWKIIALPAHVEED
jgi:hypothetical protein